MADNDDENQGSFPMTLRHVKLDFKTRRPPKKTSAEYQAEYRARIKADPKLWESYKTKQQEYHKNYVCNLTDEKKAALKAERNKRRKKARLDLKQATATPNESRSSQSTQPQKKKTRNQSCEERKYWKDKKREQRAAMTEEQKALANAKERDRKRLKRQQLRLEALGHNLSPVLASISPPTEVLSPQACSTFVCSTPNGAPAPSLTESIQTEMRNSADSDSFTGTPATPSPTKNSKYSALYRVRKVIPKSKKKEMYILKNLFLKASPSVKEEILKLVNNDNQSSKFTFPNVKINRNRLLSKTKQTVVNFYEDQAVNVPNIKFYSKRLRKQRKVLTKPIRLVFEDFRKAFPEVKVSLRNFYRSRPAHILKLKSLKFIQCLCEMCENMRLRLKALNKAGSQFSSVTDAMNATLCSFEGEWASLKCVDRKCQNCGVHFLRSILRAECELTASVTYDSWDAVTDSRCKGKKTQLVKHSSSACSLIDEFCSNMYIFASHKFVDRWQRFQFNSLKGNLPSNCALLVLDFAENYSCSYQNQAQSAYYSMNQVTLHPVVIYAKCQHCPKLMTYYRVFVSDDLKHDSNFANYVLSHSLDYLNFLGLSQFIVFSDNCAVQYKSRLPLYHLSKLGHDFDILRCYFGERHGKSECDSLGGVVKSFLRQSVITGEAILSNASEIVNFLSSNFELHNVDCSHNDRSFHLVEPKSIDRSKTSKDVPEFKGIKKVHSFKFDGTQLSTRHLSCFCSPCLSGNHLDCLSVISSNVDTIQWPQKKNKDKDGGPKKSKNNKQNRMKKAATQVQLNGFGSIGNPTECNDNVCLSSVEVDVNGDSQNVFDADGLVEADVISGTDTRFGDDKDSQNVDVFDADGLNHPCIVDSRDDCDNSDRLKDNGDKDVAEDTTSTSEGVSSVADDCSSAKKKVVCRKLFNSGPFSNTQCVFKMFYTEISKCKSFDEMKVFCGSMEFESLVINQKYSKLNIDRNAMSILPPNAPRGYLPNITVSDGNCVPRSLSYLVYGNETHHLEIRCRIIKELVNNINLYLDEDYLTLGSNLERRTIISKLVALSDSLKNIDLKRANYSESVFKAEVFDTRLSGIHLGPWHLHAAAEILGCGIISLYPTLGQPEYSEVLNRAFVPSSFRPEYQDPLFLMWTSNRSDMNKKHWVANHVVPMVKIHK